MAGTHFLKNVNVKIKLKQTGQELLAWLQKHSVGIVVAVIIALIIAVPAFVFRFSAAYQGVDMFKTNTENHYVTQIREVYDGHAWLGNPYLADVKDTPYLFPPLSPNLVAWLGQGLGLDAVTANLVTRFILVMLLGLVIYLFSYNLTGRREIGWVATPFIILGYDLVEPGTLLQILRGQGWSEIVGFIGYGRPINPQVSSLFFFSYLLFFFKYLQTNGKLRYGILSAIILGSSFYVYLFTWTFLFSLNAFVWLFYVWKKNWVGVKKVTGVSVGAALLGIPYLLHLLTITRHPWYTETVLRFGFIATRKPDISRLVSIGLIMFLIFYRWFSRELKFFFSIFFLTAFFVINEQVITGKFVFNHHYHWYYNVPLVILFLVIWVFTVQEKFFARKFFAYGLATISVGLLFTAGITRQQVAYKQALPEVLSEQRYAPILQWLQANTKLDTTVLTNQPIGDLVPVLTHNNVYYSPLGAVTLLPNERLLHSYLVYTYFEKGIDKNIRQYFEDRREDISNKVFDYQYYFQKDVCLGCFPNEIIDQMTSAYLDLSNENFLPFIKKYPLDYVLWDREKNPEWHLDRFGWKVAKEFGSLIVYDLSVWPN